MTYLLELYCIGVLKRIIIYITGWILYSNIKSKEPEQESIAEWLRARLMRMINQR